MLWTLGLALRQALTQRTTMAATLSAILPIFALLFAGWALAFSGRMPADAWTALNGFVIRLALPALLFRFVAEADWPTLWQPGLLAAMAIGVGTIFVGWLVAGSATTALADRAVDALAASYANVLFMGLPIAGDLYSKTGMTAAILASLLTICLLFACAMLVIEAGLHPDEGWRWKAVRVLSGVLRNPLVAAPLLGGLWAAGGLALPPPVHRLLELAGAAASPVALVAMGMFLATVRNAAGRRPIAGLLALKLVGQPLVTWVACRALGVPAMWTAPAVLIAALPTGTGPFMAAIFHRREVSTPAQAVLVGTILSASTIPIVAWLLK